MWVVSLYTYFRGGGGGGVLKMGVCAILSKNALLPHFLCFMVEKGICKKVSWVAAKHTTNNSMTISNSSEKRMKTLKEKIENESGIQEVR